MATQFEYGEFVLLWEERKGRTFLVTLEEGGVLHTHRGAISHHQLAGRPEGSAVVTTAGHRLCGFRPRVADRMMKVRRRTQIVYPKDAGWLVLALDLFPGAQVLEMGTGSGAFTILLAQLVGDQGRVYTFDRRRDFLDHAWANITRHGLAHRVVARQLEAGEEFPVQNADAAFLDLPQPWSAIGPARAALAPGRPLALIVPTAEQLKATWRALEEAGFVACEAVEIPERRVLVRDREGVRPCERMVGFTGYLVSARKRP
ncbi:MAG: tRNA (adenine-N1)-methyltransferase [Candidatus Bipolaricaulaceae bacterium]